MKDLDIVKLIAPFRTEHRRIEAGATGTIVHTYNKGKAFEVEFSAPINQVITVQAEFLTVVVKYKSEPWWVKFFSWR